jgi:hypothetical protein
MAKRGCICSGEGARTVGEEVGMAIRESTSLGRGEHTPRGVTNA